MKTAKKRNKYNDWLEKLRSAAEDLNSEQIKKVLEYTRWVKLKKVNDQFEEIFSKYK
jgi:hypothetical protein